MYFSLSPGLYCEAASCLCDGIEDSDYFSESVTSPHQSVDCRLTALVIVYRRTDRAPEGTSRPIADLLVWRKFHTVGPDGERLNNFSFGELKGYIV